MTSMPVHHRKLFLSTFLMQTMFERLSYHSHKPTAQTFFSSIEVVGGDENLITWLAKYLNKKEYGISETLKSALVSRYV